MDSFSSDRASSTDRKSDVAQLFVAARTKTVEQSVRFINDAAHTIGVDAARVLHPEEIGNGRRIRQRGSTLYSVPGIVIKVIMNCIAMCSK